MNPAPRLARIIHEVFPDRRFWGILRRMGAEEELSGVVGAKLSAKGCLRGFRDEAERAEGVFGWARPRGFRRSYSGGAGAGEPGPEISPGIGRRQLHQDAAHAFLNAGAHFQ